MAVPPVVDQNFNPRAPCGARRASFSRRLRAYLFQPTRPLRGATILGLGPGPSSSRRFQPTRPLRGATVLCGGDGQWLNYFNPRAPCGARPKKVRFTLCQRMQFQPTRPLRGATSIVPGVRPIVSISTHAPLAGRDEKSAPTTGITYISTHAPLAGRDPLRLSARRRPTSNFNPRAPCGARRHPTGGGGHRCKISTHAPLAGRDSKTVIFELGAQISTHAPLAGRDASASPVWFHTSSNFNPRAPCGARRTGPPSRPRPPDFNPRAPCGARLQTTTRPPGAT